MAYCHVSDIDLYLHIKFPSSRKNFLWMNGQMCISIYMYVCTSNVHMEGQTYQLY